MYCPNCGKTNSTEHKFCRSCGFNLGKTAESLAEQLATTEISKNLQDKKRRVERLLAILISSGLSILVIGIIWTIIVEVIIKEGEALVGSIFIAFIIGLVLVALLFIYRDSLNKATQEKKELPKNAEPQLSEPTQKLLHESRFESVMSVTEGTTELLMTEKKRGTKEI